MTYKLRVKERFNLKKGVADFEVFNGNNAIVYEIQEPLLRFGCFKVFQGRNSTKTPIMTIEERQWKTKFDVYFQGEHRASIKCRASWSSKFDVEVYDEGHAEVLRVKGGAFSSTLTIYHGLEKDKEMPVGQIRLGQASRTSELTIDCPENELLFLAIFLCSYSVNHQEFASTVPAI